MASWKKVIVSGSNISELNNDSNYLSTQGGGILSSSVEGDAQGQIKINGVNIDANALGTGDSPTFVAVTANLTGNVTGDVTGDVTGNADTATALETGRNFSITGDGTATAVSFDGSGNVALSLSLDDNVVDSAELVNGSIDPVHLAAGTKTAISGAFTSTSASIASDIADLEAATYDLDIQGDSGTGNITNGETLDIAGGSNITTAMSGNELSVALDDSITLTSVTADLTGDVTGNADTATALETARAFTTTGDVVLASANFDGSSNFTTTATIQANAVENSMMADDSVDSAEIVDGAVDPVHFAAGTKTAVSGAFTSTSASIASDIAALEAAEYSLGIVGDTGNGDITNAEQLDIAGGDNISTVMSGNTLTVSLDDNVVIAGNLTVQGTRTELNVANLNVEDQFILLNSGSTSGDSGIIFGASGDGVANAGHAIFVDNEAGGGANDVFKFASNIAHDATTGGAGDGKLGFIQTSTSVPSSAPSLQGVGSIHIKTDSEDIYIYS